MSDRGEKRSHLWTRDEHDWYVEPVRATEALLSVERFVGPVWDPACGGGNTLQALRAAGYAAEGSDIVDRGCGAMLQDFTAEDVRILAPNIVCNPPFFRADGTEAFIRQALRLATGKIAIFADIRFLASVKRADGLFAAWPPHRIWVVVPRVSCPPGSYLAEGNKAGNGSSDWCWFVWDRTSPRVGTFVDWCRAPAEKDVFG